MRSKFADRRVSPNVVSESAAMATSLFLRTTTRVVMAAGESKCAPSHAGIAGRRADWTDPIIPRTDRSSGRRQHGDRREVRGSPHPMRPGPEFAERRGPRGQLALAEEAPHLQESWQWVDRQRRGSGLLGKFFAARQNRDGVVQVRRCRQAEPALQPDLARCRGEQIGAAHDVSDVLCCVVDDDRKLIGEQAVGALDDEIADLSLEPLLVPSLETIAKPDRFVGHPQSPCLGLASGRGAAATRSGIDAFAAGAESPGFDLPAGAGAGEGFSVPDEALDRLLVERAAMALADDLAVPLEAVRFERGENYRCCVIAAARLVDSLDPHQPPAAGGARIAIACERSDE